MDEYLLGINQAYLRQGCCHEDKGRNCSCYPCVKHSFFDGKDDYSCLKKLCYYVMNYGPSFVSEIYHFLAASKILEVFKPGCDVNVLSLGCGFGSDLVALKKYIIDKKHDINLRYTGVDKEPLWESLRFRDQEAVYYIHDVFDGLNFEGFDIVFVNKLFSTLKRHNLHESFLSLIQEEVINNMKSKSFLIYNDVNHYNQGRDEFNARFEGVFSKNIQYFFPINDAYSGDGKYKRINEARIVVGIPHGITVIPKKEVTKAVIFCYQK